MNDLAIHAEGVTVSYRPYTSRVPILGRVMSRSGPVVHALNGVDLEARRGESIGILGKNGAGKSTLLRVLAGTLLPDEGSVEVNGRISTLLALGSGFNGDLSGRRNIVLGCLATGLSRDETSELVEPIVEFSELGEAIERPLNTYSSGMVARLAFSIGVSMRPDILMIDEVLAVGDESFRDKSREAMERLVTRAGTLVLVSHRLRVIREVCSRGVWLHQGQVQKTGDPDEVIGAYKRAVRAGKV
jgi:ABC-type polysaccharide/polyol phosphate transport system ATPase subunit